jgi:uncharacterized protein YraI
MKKITGVIILACLIQTWGCNPAPSILPANTATPPAPTFTASATQPSAAESTLTPTTAPTLSAPVEGATISQINVRAQPSTANASLGMIDIFTRVQVTGKDASGSWYRIIHADSYGWVRAEYVQVSAGDEIPIVETGSNSASGVDALVIHKINVRKGPGVEFDSIGELNQKDVARVIGRDSSGAWLHIEFPIATDGKGWVTAQFIQVDNAGILPIVDAAQPIIPATQAAQVFSSVAQDSDSRQAPLTSVTFSPAYTRILQVNGDLTENDTEDWLQFTSVGNMIEVRVLCSGDGLNVEVWNGENRTENFSIHCGESRALQINPNNEYFLRIFQANAGNLNYILTIKSFI